MWRIRRKSLTLRPWVLYNEDVDDAPEGGGAKDDPPKVDEEKVKLANEAKELKDKLAEMEAKLAKAEQDKIDATSKDELDKASKNLARLESEKKKNEEEIARLKKQVDLSNRDKLLSKFFKEKASGDKPKKYDADLVMELLGEKIPDNVEVALSELEKKFPRIVITEVDNHPDKLNDKKPDKEPGSFDLAKKILEENKTGSDFQDRFVKQNESLRGKS